MVAPERAPASDPRKLLADCGLFRDLAPDERQAIVSRARVRKFAPGETVFLMGSAGDSMMAVLSGQIRISVPSAEGKEIVLAILNAGEVFGEISVLDGKERTAEAKAIGACSLAILDRREVLAFLDRHPSAWMRLVGVLCDRLRNTDQHIAEIALLPVSVRLAKALLRIAAAEPASAKAASAPKVHLSQRELGNMVGATREAVNKCLAEWQRRRILHIEDGVIAIKDLDALEDLAC